MGCLCSTSSLNMNSSILSLNGSIQSHFIIEECLYIDQTTAGGTEFRSKVIREKVVPSLKSINESNLLNRRNKNKHITRTTSIASTKTLSFENFTKSECYFEISTN